METQKDTQTEEDDTSLQIGFFVGVGLGGAVMLAATAFMVRRYCCKAEDKSIILPLAFSDTQQGDNSF